MLLFGARASVPAVAYGKLMSNFMCQYPRDDMGQVVGIVASDAPRFICGADGTPGHAAHIRTAGSEHMPQIIKSRGDDAVDHCGILPQQRPTIIGADIRVGHRVEEDEQVVLRHQLQAYGVLQYENLID